MKKKAANKRKSWLQKREKWGSELSKKRDAKISKNETANKEKSGCKILKNRGQQRAKKVGKKAREMKM